MKIAKLTWLHNGNYGSVLQAYALQKFLLDNNYDVIDLNYRASFKVKLWNWFINHNSVKLFADKYNEFKILRNKEYAEKFSPRKKKFEDFKNKNIRMTKLCKTPAEIKKVSKDYDIFICGSDQIWSPALMNPVFYFSFLTKEQVKISYATSFGVTKTSNGKKEKIKRLLGDFNNISVREEQGEKLVKELINKDVPVLIDPTMLIDKKTWEICAGNNPVYDGKYIFCYLLTPNETYIENVRKISKEKELPVVIIPTVKGPFNTGFSEIFDSGPEEWINLIKNASYVYTDSFHGAIFSMIFHKEFVLYKRFSDNEKSSENSRVYNLTKLFGVEERLIDEKSFDKIKDLCKIDYNQIDNIIKAEASKSGSWLIKAIKNNERESCFNTQY